MNLEQMLLLAAPLLPTLAFVLLALRAWVGKKPSEVFISTTSGLALTGSALSVIGLLLHMLVTGKSQVRLQTIVWFGLGHYHFPITLIADQLSVPFALLTTSLLFITGVFSRSYLHRERGYLRYYLLLCMFAAAALLLELAGSLDVAYFGWELVGLASTLLIAFFHERKGPVRHAFRAYITYRVCDVGFLAAAVWLHHTVGGTASPHHDTAWWSIELPTRALDVAVVGTLLLWASLGKAGQVPFGGWLPRAMEGPTPSSAIFYGAISIHLGPFLLLRAADLIHSSLWVSGLVVAVGLTSAVVSTLSGRVQTDIKSRLAYASMAQVGIIFVEIGLGFHYLAIVHVAGHAVLRCLQILQSPSIVYDSFRFERKLGTALPKLGQHFDSWLPERAQLWLYQSSLERGHWDAILQDYIVRPIVTMARQIDHLQKVAHDTLLGTSDDDDTSQATPLTSDPSVNAKPVRVKS